MKTSKYAWVVKIAYDCYLGVRGNIVSKHMTYEAAEKAARKHGNFVAIASL